MVCSDADGVLGCDVFCTVHLREKHVSLKGDAEPAVVLALALEMKPGSEKKMQVMQLVNQEVAPRRKRTVVSASPLDN